MVEKCFTSYLVQFLAVKDYEKETLRGKEAHKYSRTHE